MMGIESSEVIGELELLPADDAVITIDPIELFPVDESVDLPPDAQTFGGPVDGGSEDGTQPVDDSGLLYTTFIVEDVPAEDAPVDGGSEDGTLPVDDSGLLYTTFIVDDVPAEDAPVDGGSEDGTLPVDDSGLLFTTFIVEDVPVEDVPVEGSSEDGSLPVDDSGLLYTTVIVNDAPVEDTPVEDGEVIGRPVDPEPNWRTVTADGGEDEPVIACEDYPVYIDDALVEGKPVEGSSEDGSLPIDDSGIYYTMGVPVEDVLTDGSSDIPVEVTDGVEVIGRPLDPQPNWRTLDGEASSDDTGTDDTGTDDTGIIAGEDYPVAIGDGSDILILDKDVSVEDTGSVDTDTGTDIGGEDLPDVIYTLDPSDPLIYASSAGDLPGRSSDPLPFERTNTDPVVVPEPEIDRTPVNYAQADTFHTGLDLL
jgi:hypothetical protein